MNQSHNLIEHLHWNIHCTLDDQLHFISKYDYKFVAIVKQLEIKYGAKLCRFESCDVSSRHYRQIINQKSLKMMMMKWIIF